MAEEGLRERLDHVIRDSAVQQAKAYQGYSALLSRLAARDIESVAFAREAVDLYVEAYGKVASSGVTLVGEALSAGLKSLGLAASGVAKAVENESHKPRPETSADPSTKPAGRGRAAGATAPRG